MSGSAGFSLIEVIVSLALVSLVSMSGYTLVDSLARAQDRLDKRYAQLEDLQVFLSDFSENLATSDPAEMRLEAGVLSITSKSCGALAPIQYAASAGRLDRSAFACPGSDLSLGHIARAQFEVVDAGMSEWSSWPRGQGAALPVAVRLEITFGEDEGLPGTLSRLVDLPYVAPK